MRCYFCGHEIPEDEETCPSCLKDVPKAAPPPAPEPPPPAFTLENQLQQAAAAAHIPGGSITLAGVALLVIAVVLSMLPWFYGAGWAASVILLAVAAVVIYQEIGELHLNVTPPRLPSQFRHVAVRPAFAVLVAAWALHMLAVAPVPLLFLLSGMLLAYDAYRRNIAAVRERFDWRAATTGPRVFITSGAAACFVSLFFRWMSLAGHFSGGIRYDGRYDATAWYTPGWDFTGRVLPGSALVVLILLLLVLWAVLRQRPQNRWLEWTPPILLAGLFFWLWSNRGRNLGPVLFLAGWMAMAIGWWMVRHTPQTR